MTWEKALGWMNVEWYTFFVCEVSFTFMFCSFLSCIFLSFCKFLFISSFNFFTFFSMRLCNNKNFCVNSLDLSPLTDSYFSNKLLTHYLLFEMTFSISKYDTWHDKQQDIVFQDVMFGRYVVLHFVYVYQISWYHIPKDDHSTVHIILKHPDLPLLFYCLIPMKYIVNNSS